MVRLIRIALLSGIGLLLGVFPAFAHIAPTKTPQFLSFAPLHAPTPAAEAAPTTVEHSRDKKTRFMPLKSHLQPSETATKPPFIPLNRSSLAPVRARQLPMVTAPLRHRLQPVASPMLSAPTSASAQPLPNALPTKSSFSASPTLDLFDNRSAPLPSPGNFYRALRASTSTNMR